MKLKLACPDFTFPLLKHEHALQLIAMLGIKGVDIGLFEKRSHLQPSIEFKNVRRSARRLKRKLDDLGLKAADIFMQSEDSHTLAINHPQRYCRRRLSDWYLKTLEYAAECNCNHVTITPGVHYKEESYSDSFTRSVEELQWRVDEAKKHRIVLGVEAHIDSLVPRPKTAEKLIKSVPGLTLTLDYGHFVREGCKDAVIDPLLKYASHFHVRGGCKGRLQTSFESNTIDFKKIFKVMQKIGYRGWLTLEYVWIDWEHCNECDNISETILYRDFFRSLVRETNAIKTRR